MSPFEPERSDIHEPVNHVKDGDDGMQHLVDRFLQTLWVPLTSQDGVVDESYNSDINRHGCSGGGTFKKIMQPVVPGKQQGQAKDKYQQIGQYGEIAEKPDDRFPNTGLAI